MGVRVRCPSMNVPPRAYACAGGLVPCSDVEQFLPCGFQAHFEVRILAGSSRTGSRLSVTRVGGARPNRAGLWWGPGFQCRSCADFKVAVTIARLAEAERTWVMMQGETPQAGNRARKSLRRHQWSDHAGELGPGSLCHTLAWDGRAPILHPGTRPT